MYAYLAYMMSEIVADNIVENVGRWSVAIVGEAKLEQWYHEHMQCRDHI